MPKIKVVCSGCGIWIMTDDSRTSILCPKCGTEILVNPVINVSHTPHSPVVASGAELESKLAYAEGLLTAECYYRAEKAFRNAAVLFPDDYRCHWGIVRSGTKNFTDYNCSDYAVDYANAVRNADEIPLRSMKENYSKYLDERRKSEYERKVSGKIAMFEPEPPTADDKMIATAEQAREVDLYEVSKKAEEPPAPAPEPEPAPEPPKPAVDPNVSFLLREQLNQRLNQHNEACKSASAQLNQAVTDFEEYKEKHRGFGSYQVKQTPPILEIVWFGLFAFPALIFLVFILLKKLLWLMWPLFIVFSIFAALMLFNLLQEMSFKKKISNRRIQDDGEFKAKSKEFDRTITDLNKQIAYHKEQMAAVKRKIQEEESRLQTQ